MNSFTHLYRIICTSCKDKYFEIKEVRIIEFLLHGFFSESFQFHCITKLFIFENVHKVFHIFPGVLTLENIRMGWIDNNCYQHRLDPSCPYLVSVSALRLRTQCSSLPGLATACHTTHSAQPAKPPPDQILD